MATFTSVKLLNITARLWLTLTIAGQWLFVLYIAGFYGKRFLAKGIPGFADTHLPNGYIPGDSTGNIAIVMHILLAMFIIAGGTLQLLPAIRKRYPAFHRWNGRIYVCTAIVVSLAGLYLTFARERVIGSLPQEIGTSLGGVLILIFSPVVIYYALKRQYLLHQRWALRLFMLVSAVWFLRILTFGWFLLTGGWGINRSDFSGPFLVFAAFAQYMLPLAVLELYFRAKDMKQRNMNILASLAISVGTVYMAVGVGVLTAMIWLPRVLK
ncbi:Predicted membrane protein [Alteromonadaceae bacterium Bs31]|nr:Predicted membrane protein [Alteromonadaceae bacterium Bs31]